MCGINLVFAYDGAAPPVAHDELVRVRDAMVARGPDGAGAWIAADGRVGLAHRRLAIINLSPSGAQPMALADDPAGAPSVTFNGEIYNYRELRRELEETGATFRSTSDTEVLLHLYARHGRAMVGRLRGMFAFAIWDPAARGVFMARDPMGIKPLYYADDGRTLRAASQVKALLAGGGIDTAPAPAGHAGFFLWGYVPDPHTLYRGVHALPAGTSLWVDAAGAHELETYFDVGRELAGTGEASAPPTRAERLREALANSVGAHLVADVPVGVFLSAGLDSTTIASLAREAADSDLRTVTLGFEEYRGDGADETGLAEQAAGLLATRHQTRWVAGREFADDYDSLLAAMDQPSINDVNTYFVAKVTAAAGLKVALSGVGGDELFAGYPSFAGVPALARHGRRLRHLPGRAALRALLAPVVGRLTSPKYAGVLEYCGTIADAYLLRRALFMPWEISAIIGREMARTGLAELAARDRLADTVAGVARPRAQVSALELVWYMRGQLLRDADWAGMAHSLEIRTPLVDAALLAALAPLIAGPTPPTKQDMAQTPATVMPAAILDRPKTGFQIPVRRWLVAGHAAAAGAAGERGLRGWARTVYAAFTASA